MEVQLKSTRDFVNHLRHCIQEEHNIHLSEKAVADILNTLLASNRISTKGSIENMQMWQARYFEQVKAYDMLARHYLELCRAVATGEARAGFDSQAPLLKPHG